MAAAFLVAVAADAADGVWIGGTGVWTNQAQWVDGVLPDAGGTASFVGASDATVTVPSGYPFTLSALLVNTNASTASWTLAGGLNTLVSPASVRVDAGTLTVSGSLQGSAGLAKSGNGFLELTATNNLFTGPVTVSGGILRARADGSLGPAPAAQDAAAITLDGATLSNVMDPLTLDANRGITVGPGGAWFMARFFTPTRIEGPVTGAGSVSITRNSSAVTFSNPANDYAGDTILGADGLGYWTDAKAQGVLRLGADEVIPDGAGKGRLYFNSFSRGILDLNGKTETVNTVAANGDLCVSNSAATPGVLRVGADDGDSTVSGEIQTGATIEKIGAGVLRFSDNNRSAGNLKVSEGLYDFSQASALGGLTITLDGGSLRMSETQPGLLETVGTIASGAINLGVAMTAQGVRQGTIKGYAGANDFSDYRQYGYRGQWYVPTAGLYSFGKAFDDGAYLALDGKPLISNNTASAYVSTQNVAVSAGWHTIDVRFSQGSGAVGPKNGYTAGIMYDPNNTTISNAVDVAAAFRFEDPGDGSVLRTTPLGSSEQTVRARLELAQDSAFDRSGTAASLVWAGDVVAAAGAAGVPVLTVSGGSEPFRIGSTNRPSVYGVDVDDANGVRFQNKVWLLMTPTSSSWSYAAGADLAAGAPGVLGSGPLTLTDRSLRIPIGDALGAGGETVTVQGTGNAVRFDATRETGGRLLDDPTYAFAASNNVVLSGTSSSVGFEGAGTVTYAGTISGSGSLVKNGTGDAVLTAANTFSGVVQVNAGRLRVSADDQLGNAANAVTIAGGYLGNVAGSDAAVVQNITVSSGGFDVQDASLTLSGVLSGSAAKRGAGTLSLDGFSANSAFDLTALAGVTVLNKSGASAVRHLLGAEPGAVVRLAGSGGNQISGGATLTGGTLDLNGLSESLTILGSTNPASRVTNGGASLSVLTVGEGNMSGPFAGALTDGGGVLALTKTGTGAFRLLGGDTPQSYSGATRVEQGTLMFGAAARYVRFTVLQTRTVGQNPGISEFQLTLDGETVLLPTGVVASASTFSVPTGGPERLIDNNAVTKWLATANNGQFFRLDLRRPVAFNGYRWFTANDMPERDPVSWVLEVSADNNFWYTVDTRTLQSIPTTRSMLAGDWALPVPYGGGYAASALSALYLTTTGSFVNVYTRSETVQALVGTGTVSLAANTDLRVGDVSAFTGRFAGDGRLRIGGAGGETRFASLSSSPYQTIVNDGSAALDVVLDNGTNASFTASVADGSAPAGLIKRGASTVLMHGQASAYTGDTRVEAGTLAILPGTLVYRYLKFTPTQTRGYSSFPVSISEFQLVRDNLVLAWPAGTVVTSTGASHASYPPPKAIDGNWTSDPGRWITASGVFPNSLVFDMLAPVAFDGYQYYTGTSAVHDNPRDPISWRLEGSRDGTNWTLLDVRTAEPVPDVRGNLVGPYLLGGRALPPALWANTDTLDEKVKGVTARYLRWNPTRTRQGGYEYAGTGFQISELQLLAGGVAVSYPVGTTAYAPGGGYNQPAENNVLTPDKAVDNIVPTGNTNNRWYSQVWVNPLTVDMGQPVTFDAYRLYTGLYGAARDPVSWTLEVSNDATNWWFVDVRTNVWGTLLRNSMIGEWPLDVFARGGAAACAIPDSSRTFVAAGAVLKLEDGASETVGPLTGNGAVALVGGAAFGVNAFENAAYSGGFNGVGTVAKTGAATQTLSGALAYVGDMLVDEGTLDLTGATLTGVTNIVLRGGALTGAAAVNGGLTVSAQGGGYCANLAVAGALTVAGELRLVLPEDASLPYVRRLFAFASADTSTRAALANSASTLAVPRGYRADVKVSASEARLVVSMPGTLLLFN